VLVHFTNKKKLADVDVAKQIDLAKIVIPQKQLTITQQAKQKSYNKTSQRYTKNISLPKNA